MRQTISDIIRLISEEGASTSVAYGQCLTSTEVLEKLCEEGKAMWQED